MSAIPAATRPLTLADRSPVKGDIIRGPYASSDWKMWEYNAARGYVCSAQYATNGAFRSFRIARIKKWHYVSRADNGATTVAVEESK
jgi:hypothetical protein